MTTPCHHRSLVLALLFGGCCHHAPTVRPAAEAPRSTASWVHGKHVEVSANGDPNEFARLHPLPCKPAGDHRPELIAPIYEYVRATLLDHRYNVRLFYEDSDVHGFDVINVPDMQTVVLDPRAERGILIMNIKTEEFHYCIRVTEQADKIQIVLDLFDLLTS